MRFSPKFQSHLDFNGRNVYNTIMKGYREEGSGSAARSGRPWMIMQLSNPETVFKILSVIELRLPAQHTVIAPRPHSTLSFRMRGNALFRYGGSDFSLGTDDVLFVPAGCSYHIDSEPENILCINLSVSGSEAMTLEYFVLANVPVLKEAFKSIYEIWSLKEPGYYQKSMSTVYAILYQLEKQCSQTYHSPAFHTIKHAVNYMHAHFADPELSISSLCRIANLSDTQFRRNFYEVYKTTPLKYLQSLRVNYAADLLSGSSLSIEDISAMSGFADSKYFCTVFKKYKLRPPSSFRKSL